MQARTPDDVQAALDALGLDIQVQMFETSTATSQEAADSIGTSLGSIAKSLCFLVGGEPVVVIASGDQRVDDRKLGALREVSRKKVKIANAEATVEATGYAPGGVPPVGHANALPIYLDQTLSRFELVYAAAGSPNAIFPIPYQTLVEVTGGEVVDLAKV
jgi:prolyl-tRNA editing enzyme YbaK/EbsC (Cys-tRNA(Pro) deacylase)